MLGKLLKYDIKYIFRYWWLGALISLAVSFAGGFCAKILASEKEFSRVVTTSATLVLVLAIVALIAFVISSLILVLARFYKNFFSDEGYLTFTLPVKNSSLLASKLIAGVGTVLLALAVVTADVLLIVWFGVGNKMFKGIADFFAEGFKEVGAVLALYLFEILLLIVVYVVFSVLFAYFCITFASTITKKAKVITAIGIYYGANSVITFMTQMFTLFALQSLIDWLAPMTGSALKLSVALILFAVALFFSMLCLLIYILQSYMLDRKLNLA